MRARSLPITTASKAARRDARPSLQGSTLTLGDDIAQEVKDAAIASWAIGPLSADSPVLNQLDTISYEVIDFETLINEVALLRNKYLGIMKGLDTKQWQLGHIVRLRTAGMEDVQV